MIEDPKRIGDAAAFVGGGAGTLAQWSELAGVLTPIFSAAFILISILWLLWRMLDRWRFGPRGRGDE